jgi:3-phenylpropionate/trans-cinnamate dioxygenase ferredoxin reductase subunit
VDRVVIVGGGQAGCQAAVSLREVGFTGSIVVFGAEPDPPYQRPPLSKGHLTGMTPRETLWLRPRSWFDDNGIDLRSGVEVIGIDRAARTVDAADGTGAAYDALVLALGSRHRTLPIPGAKRAGVVSLRTLADADDLRGRLNRATDVVVIGGGFIGLEVASTAVTLGKRTTVVEVESRLMSRVVSPATADLVREFHRKRGLAFELGRRAVAFCGEGADDAPVRAVELDDGRRIRADLVVLGVGADPEVGVATAAGLEGVRGIVVDEDLRTADSAIFAVGDCARAPNPFAREARVRVESVQNAVAQARRVADSLMGRPRTDTAVPWFWSDQADLKVQIAGITVGCDEVVCTGEPSGGKQSVWCFFSGRLIGVESINHTAAHMAARKLLAARAPLTPLMVSAPEFDPSAYAKTFAAAN